MRQKQFVLQLSIALNMENQRMRYPKHALKLILPYGLVRAYQIFREYDRMKAQSEIDSIAAQSQALVKTEERARENAEVEAQVEAAREEEKKIFSSNEIIYNGIRIFSCSEAPKVSLNIYGTNNTIILNKFDGKGALHINMQHTVRDCKFEFGQKNKISANLFVNFYFGGGISATNSLITIGDNNVFNGNVHINAGIQNGTIVSIGSENLFADNIHIQGAVDHLIYDISTKEKYSKEFGVTIKNKIWICNDVLILNKAQIPSETIVAARSIVNKPFAQTNTLLSGAPAKVTKKNVMWHLNTTDDYLSTNSPLMNCS